MAEYRVEPIEGHLMQAAEVAPLAMLFGAFVSVEHLVGRTDRARRAGSAFWASEMRAAVARHSPISAPPSVA